MMTTDNHKPCMKNPATVLLLLVLLFAWSHTFSQDVRVQTSLDTNAMLIGDHVGMKLEFSGPSGTQVIWPLIPDTILGNISVIGRGKIDTVFSQDRNGISFTQEFTLTCYDSGFYTIPQITFPYRILPDTSVRIASSELMLLAVHTVQVDTTKAIKPIIGPLKVRLTFREILPWILLGIGVLALVAGGLWYWKRRSRKQPVLQFRPKVVLMPHEVALQELEKLRLKKLWQSGKIKEYHSELTEIIRRYIEDRFRVPALEQTSGEILQALSDHGACPAPAQDRLSEVLVLADMVKFAKALPVATENERSMNEAIEFVHDTTYRTQGPSGVVEQEVKTNSSN